MALFDKKMHDPVPAVARVVDSDGLRTAGRLDAAQQAMADRSASAAQAASGSPPWGAQVAGAQAAPHPVDPVDLIARLADLRDRGALTDAEFDVQKKRILAG
jgi:hypothetical protein